MQNGNTSDMEEGGVGSRATSAGNQTELDGTRRCIGDHSLSGGGPGSRFAVRYSHSWGT